MEEDVMRRSAIAVGAMMVVVAVVAPIGGAPVGAVPDPAEIDEFSVVENTAEVYPQVSGPWVAYTTDEGVEGEDLNGDGDLLDHVIRLVDTRTQQERNTGLTALSAFMGPAFNLAGDTLTVMVPESSHGETDLNGDGDANDVVYHVYDVPTAATTNLEVAAGNYTDVQGYLSEGGSVFAFLVGEEAQGNTDLNGDGDVTDLIAHVWHGGELTNMGLSSRSAHVSNELVVFTASELDSDGTDLNSDGDTDDWVAHVYDVAEKMLTNLGIAGGVYGGWEAGSVAQVGVSEWSQGNTDLNGDGDTADSVLHVHDVRTDVTTNLGLIAPTGEYGRVGRSDLVCFEVFESEQGGDLNEDGDTDDLLIHLYEPPSTSVTNTNLDGYCGVIGDGYVLLRLREDGAGADLNGDGDMTDSVSHILDRDTEALTNLSIAGWAARGFGDRVVIVGNEDNYFDYNEDGDGSDRVAFVYDHSDESLTNTERAVYGEPRIGAGLAAMNVPEADEGGTDLNGDGDSLDHVIHLYTLDGRVILNGARAVPKHQDSPVGDDFATAVVSETDDGWTDHNGDGDKDDQVLFIMSPVPPNVGPVAEANGPYAVDQGTTVSFSAAGSGDADGTIVSWLWEFGDGSTSTLADPTHRYLDVGVFSVSLTVTDDHGATDSDTATVTVTRVDAFTDDDDSVFERDAEWMAAAVITKGCNPPTNDEFCPDEYVTRGQMAAFLARALELSERADDPFVDDDDSIFEPDIEKLAYSGITKGCNPAEGNTKFCPDSRVTRGQMAAFLVRALGYTDVGDGDLFTDDDGSIFESDIDKLGTAGVTKGCNPPTNDRFCPDAYVTRGQMAAFLHRALG
jgi:PKD repeat protein